MVVRIGSAAELPSDDWVDITRHFDPGEDLNDLLKPLRECRVLVADGDGLHIFLDEAKRIRHAVYWLSTKWICPCSDRQPCAAVVVLQVTSFHWSTRPSHTPGAN